MLDARPTCGSREISRRAAREYTGTAPTTLQYDTRGNRTLLQDGTGRYTYTYDALSRPDIYTNPADKSIAYSYDGAGRRNGIDQP